MYWCLSVPEEPDAALHNASDVEAIAGTHVDPRHATPAEGLHRGDHLVEDIATVRHNASGELALLRPGLRILACDTLKSDVETARDAIPFGHLSKFGRDIFVDGEVKRPGSRD